MLCSLTWRRETAAPDAVLPGRPLREAACHGLSLARVTSAGRPRPCEVEAQRLSGCLPMHEPPERLRERSSYQMRS